VSPQAVIPTNTMEDLALADIIKANKLAKKKLQKKKPGGVQQGGVKKAKNKQNVKAKNKQNFKPKNQQNFKAKNQQNFKAKKQQQGGKKKQNVQNGFQAKKNWRPKAANNIVKNFKSFNKPAAAAPQIKTGPAKIQIRNLDFGVTEADVQELFAEFGTLKKAAIHFTAQGTSMGVADLIYARRADAVKAIKQYNNVQLDGRPMKITMQENQQQVAKKPNILKRLTRGAAPISRGDGRGNLKGRGALRGNFKPRGGQRGTFKPRGGQRGTFKQRGGAVAKKGAKKPVKKQGKKKQVKKEVTIEDLDKQLDAYIQAKA